VRIIFDTQMKTAYRLNYSRTRRTLACVEPDGMQGQILYREAKNFAWLLTIRLKKVDSIIQCLKHSYVNLRQQRSANFNFFQARSAPGNEAGAAIGKKVMSFFNHKLKQRCTVYSL